MDRAKEIFLNALDAGQEQRTLLIDRECGGDLDLRARVLSLLAAHDRAGKVIIEPTVHPWNVSDAPAAPIHPPGSTIGPYVIQSVLGEGGFGTVYLARQEQPVRRLVALKIIRPGMDTRDVIRRFELERQALALMDHPGIAKVYDAGTTPTGQPYFVMEYVNGLPINEFCDTNRLSIRQRIELLDVVCLAIQHAHGRGVIHRDLKPSNILVSMLDGKPFPTVIDFGIAKALHAHPHGHATLTLPQQIIGTPQYMPPEQARLGGDDLDIDTRADVYSLGAVLYELLTGNPVFATESLRNLRPSELERLICDTDPPRPSARVAGRAEAGADIAAARGVEPARLSRLLAGDLDWITMRALEKDRNRRYPTALSLAEDLRRFLADEPVHACPPTLSYRVGKFARRHRIEFAAGAIVAASLVAFAFGAAWMAWREHRAADDAKRQLARANALTGFAQDILSGVDPAEARGMDSALLKKILTASEAKVHTQLAEQPEAAASMLNAIGFAYYQLGDVTRAEPILRQALARLDQAPAADPTVGWETRETLAAVLVEANHYDEAQGILQQLLTIRRREQGTEHNKTLATESNLAFLLARTGRLREARAMFENVASIRARTLGPDHLETLNTLNNLASVLDDLGEHEQTVATLERVARGQAQILGPDHPKTLQTNNNLASAYKDIGRVTEARDLYARVLEAKRRVSGPDHPSTITTMSNLAGVLNELKEFDESEKLLTEALSSARRTLGVNNLRTISVLNAMAQLHRLRGHPELAEPLLVEAVDAMRTILGERHPSLAVLVGNLAQVQLAANKLSEAEATARDAAAIAAAGQEPVPENIVTARRIVVRVLVAQSRHSEAAQLLEETLGGLPELPAKLREELMREAAALFEQAGNTDRARHWQSQLPATQPAN